MQNPPISSGGRKFALDCDAWNPRELSDFLQFDEAAHGIARLSARPEPVFHALGVQLNLRGLLEGVVGSDRFHNATVARLAALNHYHAIKRLLFLSEPRQTNRQHKNTPPESSIVLVNSIPSNARMELYLRRATAAGFWKARRNSHLRCSIGPIVLAAPIKTVQPGFDEVRLKGDGVAKLQRPYEP